MRIHTYVNKGISIIIIFIIIIIIRNESITIECVNTPRRRVLLIIRAKYALASYFCRVLVANSVGTFVSLINRKQVFRMFANRYFFTFISGHHPRLMHVGANVIMFVFYANA